MERVMQYTDLFTSRPKTPCEFAQANADQLSAEFLKWLPANIHVWDAFVAETFKIIERGYDHYSARTIVHVLRHHSAIEEKDGEYKINNNYSPYLGRLFDLIYPQNAGLFEYRTVRVDNDFTSGKLD